MGNTKREHMDSHDPFGSVGLEDVKANGWNVAAVHESV